MVKVIIDKGISDMHYILLEGHTTNKEYRQLVGGTRDGYKAAYSIAQYVYNTVNMLEAEVKRTTGRRNEVELCVTQYTESDMVAYHELMAFVPLKVLDN